MEGTVYLFPKQAWCQATLTALEVANDVRQKCHIINLPTAAP
jgi:hypothetical protein